MVTGHLKLVGCDGLMVNNCVVNADILGERASKAREVAVCC